MNKQFNALLILGFVFVVWLFVNTIIVSHTKLEISNMKEIQEHAKLDIKRQKLNQDLLIANDKRGMPSYQVSAIKVAGASVPFIYNEKTGQTFKYYIGSGQDNGWVPMWYLGTNHAMSTPEEFFEEYQTTMKTK